MKNKIFKISTLFALAVFLLTAGFGCKGQSQDVVRATKPITLQYWRVQDASDTFSEILASYQALRPFVTVEYRRLRAEEYEQQLLDAWAEGRGPDIFSIPNTWINKYRSKILPLPTNLTVPYTVDTGTIKKEKKVILRQETTIRPAQVRDAFVDQVSQDVTSEKQIWGLPLSLDTLVLYSNRDLLNTAGVAQAPRTWEDFRVATKKITKQDARDELVQSGAAIGTATNVPYAEDILAALILQLGGAMENSDRSAATFDKALVSDRERSPGVEALRFYTDFSNPAKEQYTWNAKQPGAFSAFLQGKTAFYFGYADDLPLLLTQAPHLNLEISNLPQLDPSQPVNVARYWVETVFNNPNPDRQKQMMAWDFVQFMTRAEQAKTYLKQAGRPTALRSLIDAQIKDEDLRVFAGQVLTAKSWYHGKNPTVATQAIQDMITKAVAGVERYEEIIRVGAARVTETY